MGLPEHRAAAAKGVRCAIITVSDTRTLDSDSCGLEMSRLIAEKGHLTASRAVVPDEPSLIAQELRRRLADPEVDAVILSGGTGIARRDVTVDVVEDFLDRELPGFGELFRALSHSRIGPAAMLSRATGGIAAGKPVFCLPGSPQAVVLGMEEVILPELGHIIEELKK